MGKKTRKEPTPKHTHRYIKIGGKYTAIWKCAKPDCKHFVYLAQENVIIGRYSECWGCGLKFIMDEMAMMDDQPQCFACRNPEAAELDIDKILREKLAAIQSEDKPESEEV